MRIGLLIVLLAASPAVAQEVVATSSTTATSTPASAISAKESAALLGLARSAMLEYLSSRASADKQQFPSELSSLHELKSGAAVSLRLEGRLDGQAICISKGSLPENVISAALSAMRSPSLPDRVTPELLRAAVIEIETVEDLSAVDPKRPAQYVQGITGLMLKYPAAEAFSLPSAAYEYGLSSVQAQARCGAQLSQSRRAIARWHTFTSRHFVAYPDGRCYQLVRGKLPIAQQMDRAANLLQAAQVGLYLQTHQDKDGCFRAGGSRASLSEHLYAAFAMSRLSNVTGEPYDARRALKYAKGLSAKADDLTYLQSDSPQDQLRAAALYIIASNESGVEQDDLRDELTKTILARMEMPQLPGQLDGKSQLPAPRAALYLVARALAGNESKAAKLLIERASSAAPDLAMAALWKGWAGLGLPQVPPELAIHPSASGLPDERGGMCLINAAAPQTIVTGLAAHAIQKQLEQAIIDRDGRSEGLLRVQLRDAQWFCGRMIYQDREAYFASDPGDWVGAVRSNPASAGTDVLSCAAAIEALLVK